MLVCCTSDETCLIYELNEQLELKGKFLKKNSDKSVSIHKDEDEKKLFILSKMGHLDIFEVVENEQVY